MPRPPASPDTRTRRQFSAGLFASALLLHGRRAAAEATPQRIVSTAPSSTEALFALGLGPRVVGVSIYCEYPPEVKLLPKVGSYVRPDLEAIVRLRPDLVALQRHPGSLTERLSALGIRFVEMPYGRLADVYTGITLLAGAAGAASRGTELNRRIAGSLAEIKARADRSPRARAVVIADRRAGLLADLIAVGPDNYVNDVMEIAGAVNVLGEGPAAVGGAPPYPRISLETVLRANPDVIVDLTDSHDADAAHERARAEDLRLWAAQKDLAAVRERRVFVGTSVVLLVPGPRTPEAAQQFFRYFHDRGLNA